MSGLLNPLHGTSAGLPPRERGMRRGEESKERLCSNWRSRGFFFGERGKGEKSPSPCCEKERLNAVYLCSKRTFVNIDQQERLKVGKAADKRADITYLWNNNASITAF